ncbi:hypothetical protein [Bosea sp. TAB14]|uniref:hypothetical protein n=1 Tax=Bosea sp. TAB14 TaxID=3237481 RepID=UPI003F8FE027
MGLDIRRVIEGKVFNTNTAEYVLTTVRHKLGYGDFTSELTCLYRTKKGQWFLAGKGGASTRWCRPSNCGSSTVEGEGLRLISPEEAQELLEEHDGDVEAYFEVEEG